jgi:signal transduction histidine kinase
VTIDRDKLLSSAAEALNRLLGSDDFDAAVADALRTVGEAARLHRVKVILPRAPRGGEAPSHDLTYEWWAPPLQSQASFGVTHFPDAVTDRDYLAHLRAGRNIFQFIDEVKPPLRSSFERVGMRSMGIVPIMIGTEYAGMVAFDDCAERRVFSSGEMDALAITGRAIGAAVSRREMQKREAQHAAQLAASNEALRCSLVTVSRGPIDRAPELMLLEVARAAGAESCYWLAFDPAENALSVAIRIVDGRIAGPPADEPELFCRPFAADVTPAFAHLCAADSFVTLSAHAGSGLIWPGVLDWHRRHGRTEALAYVVRVGDKVLGVVGMAFTDRITMNETQEQLVRSLSDQFALALQLSRLAAESERAAVERSRAAELQSANDAMRRAVDRLAVKPDLEAFLFFVLLEIATQLGTDTAAITPFHEAGEADEGFRLGAVLHDGLPAPAEPVLGMMTRSEARFRERLSDASGFCLLDVDVEEDAAVFEPEAVEYLRARGKRYSASFAIRVDGRLYGQISLSFAERPRIKPQQTALVQALSTQAALAIQVTRLAQASQDAETARAIAAERNRMAGEIHDSLAQSFTSIALQTESLIAKLSADAPWRPTLELIESTARTGLAEARSSVLALRPVGDAVGELHDALTQLAERCTIAGSVICEFLPETKPCVLRADIRDAVLRVAQEAVTNALRHARCERIVISLHIDKGYVRLSVEDDGDGIRALPTSGLTGFGIEGMRGRAHALGGSLTVEPKPGGRGTIVGMSVACDAEVRA